MFAASLAMLLIAVSAICGHRSAKLIGGTEANFWRITFATLFLAAWAYTFGQGMAGSALPIFLISGVLGIGLGDISYFQALPKLGPRLCLLIVQCLTAPFAALIEWLWLGTTLTWLQLLFGLVTLAGVGIALAPGEHVHIPRHQLVSGVIASVIAALGGAGGAVLSRKAYAVLGALNETIHPIDAGFQRVAGGCLISAFSLLIVKRQWLRRNLQEPSAPLLRESAEKWRRVWIWIVLNSLAGQTLAMSCVQWAFETTPTGIVLPIVAMAPIAVIPMAYAFEGERPSLHSIVGGLIAVGGVIGLMVFAR